MLETDDSGDRDDQEQKKPTAKPSETTSGPSEEFKKNFTLFFNQKIIPSLNRGDIDIKKLKALFISYYQTDATIQFERKIEVSQIVDDLFNVHDNLPAVLLGEFKKYFTERFGSSLSSYEALLCVHAVITGDIHYVTEQLSNVEFDPTIFKDRDGQGLLFFAGWQQNFAMFKALIDCNKYTPAKLGERDTKYRHTILHLCVRMPRREGLITNLTFVKLLIEKKIDVNLRMLTATLEESRTAIHVAVMSGNYEESVVVGLWCAGADIMIGDHYNKIPYSTLRDDIKGTFHETPDTQLMLILLEFLHSFERYRPKEESLLQQCIKYEKNLKRPEKLDDVINYEGIGVVHFALERYPDKFIEFIIKLNSAGVLFGLSPRSDSRMESPLELVAQNQDAQYLSIFLFLLLSVDNIDIEILKKYAAKGSSEPMLTFLEAVDPAKQQSVFDLGSIIDQADNILLGASEIFERLIKHIKTDLNGYAILHCLRIYQQVSGDINKLHEDGSLLHHLILRLGEPNVDETKILNLCRLLVAAGVNVNHLNKTSMTVLDYAKQRNSEPLRKFFEKNDAVTAEDKRKKDARAYAIDALQQLKLSYKMAHQQQLESKKGEAKPPASPKVSPVSGKKDSPLFSPILPRDIIENLITRLLADKSGKTLRQVYEDYTKSDSVQRSIKAEPLQLMQKKLTEFILEEQNILEGKSVPKITETSVTVIKYYNPEPKNKSKEDKPGHKKSPSESHIPRGKQGKGDDDSDDHSKSHSKYSTLRN